MRISGSAAPGRWRRICASRHELQEHSGIVIPVRGQIAMLGLSIGRITRRLEPPQAAKTAPERALTGFGGPWPPEPRQCGKEVPPWLPETLSS